MDTALTTIPEHNTRRLFSVPGLVDRLAITVGNAVFVPKTAENVEEPWNRTEVTIDDKPVIFFSAPAKTPQSVSLVPFSLFTSEGLRHIFRHAPPPKEFFICLSASKKHAIAHKEQYHG